MFDLSGLDVCIYIYKKTIRTRAHTHTSMDKEKNNRTGHGEDEEEKEQLLSSIKVEIDKTKSFNTLRKKNIHHLVPKEDKEKEKMHEMHR